MKRHISEINFLLIYEIHDLWVLNCLCNKKKTKTKETNKTGEMLKAVSIKKTNLYMLHIVHRKSMVI